MESSDFKDQAKLGDTVLVLKSKDLIEVDPADGENFYAYDLIPMTEAYAPQYHMTPIEVYVKVSPTATSEYHEMQIGQKFKLVLAK